MCPQYLSAAHKGQGRSRHRKSLFLHWKRTNRIPALGSPIPYQQGALIPKDDHSILRGLKLELQSWIALELLGFVEVQKAKTKEINLTKEIQEVS